MIYTLEWIKKEATSMAIGKESSSFQKTDALELLRKIQEVEDLLAELGI